MSRRLLALGLVLLLAAAAGVSRSALEAMGSDELDEMLYLPSGKHLRVMSLGHASLLADAVFLWAIQYYGDYERDDRQRYIEHVFSNVITELDPHYIDAYWLGALILAVESNQLEAALRLLEKGAERNPDNWILPYLAAWECVHAGLDDRAREYFDRASRIPGGPGVVRRMAAGMQLKAGNLTAAIETWTELRDDPTADGLSVKIAERKLRELVVRRDLQMLDEAVRRFRIDNGRHPSRLEELLSRSYIGRLPRDPDGAAYLYDPRRGAVSSSAGRVLGDQS